MKWIPRDQTVMFTEIGSSSPAAYFAFINKKMIYKDTFDDYDYTNLNGRSLRWFQDFTDRFCTIYAERAKGTVYLVSRWPNGPSSDCSVWTRAEFPVLKRNRQVTSIILVNYLKFSDQRQYWPDPNEDDQRSKQPGGNSGAGAIGIIVPALGDAAGAGTGVLGGKAVVPASPTQSVSTLGTPSPAPDWSSVDWDSLNGIEMDILENDTAGNTDEKPLDQPTKRSLTERAPSGGKCFDWAGEGEDPNQKKKSDIEKNPGPGVYQMGISTSDFPPNNYGGGAQAPPDPKKVDPPSGFFRVRVKQYRRYYPYQHKGPFSYNYKLDAMVIDSQDRIVGSVFFADAPDYTPVKVETAALTSLFITTQKGTRDPLLFRWGEFAQGENAWDSNDKTDIHQCTVSAWKDGVRTIFCRFHIT